jgi:methyl-accepting chemotaxis protein
MKITKYKDWKTFSKIFGLIIASLVPVLLLILFYFLPQVENKLYDEKGIATKKTVEIAISILNELDAKVANNTISLEDAQKQAISVIKDLRYDGKEYFWINSLDLKMIMHPYKPELNGTDLSENKDPNGKKLFAEMAGICKEKGEGFVDYMWEKPGAGVPMSKISFVKLFSKWGWIVGSGIYVDDVQAEISSMRLKILLSFLILFILILSFTFLFVKKLTKPLIELTLLSNKFVAEKFSYENYNISVTSNDEIGILTKSFNLLIDTISGQLQYLNNLPAPVMVVDSEFGIQYMNKIGADLLGKTQQELIGQKCYDNFKTLDCKTEKCSCAQAMKKGIIASEETIAHPNGLTLPILYTGAPVRDKTGQIVGAVEFVADMTEVKNTQNYLTKKTDEMLKVMNQFAQGDLTVELVVEKDDQIGKLFDGFNKSIKNVSNLIKNVMEAVKSTANASSQISSSSEEMAAGTQEQSTQITEIAGAVEEMTKTVIETSKNVNLVADNSKLASENAKKGARRVEETKKGMEDIVKSTLQTGKIISSLAIKTDEIGEISQVIDDIADQTNLLALNAAIEAARAGEQGRGFAVVADEVRKLAERTSVATKEIANKIKTIQKEAKDADASMIEAGESVKKGMELTEQVAVVLNEILNVNSDVSDMINQVAAASEEQSTTAEEISRNLDSMSSVTLQSVGGTQLIAKAAEDLNQLTDNLQMLIEEFKLDNSKSEYVVRSNGKLIKHA